MKNVFRAVICIGAAILTKFLPGFGVSWRVDEHTHRGIALNNTVFWVFLFAAGLFFLLEGIQRTRTYVP